MEHMENWVQLSTTGVVKEIFDFMVSLAKLGGNVASMIKIFK
ncbi:hypothetical protein QP992_10775 [Corynebacterium ulcerans]|uniref:Cell wall channel n=2 Tax=Corynebacterium ulcerans TaxID=65058 RepID=A0ABD7MVW0_CORUL|nr:hypothetical protein [Corynebacterium ulcerans]AEG82409.1 hypothetical protein CULC809_01882 [Corynebacterium ulcerans 809]AKN77884.1 Hypothetical protein CulFRC58_2030 [Corynebacterium ulcerans FRC58]AIT89920.1 Hypothetical protein Cul210932_2009 [Corynebacterium ulcerans]AIU92535.1 Hypothetical protein Cul05146_1994 [Corynebacterium ulcerans]ALD95715.1 Hypothetical protein Cul131001_2041 [Corynebacterium ulcerans]